MCELRLVGAELGGSIVSTVSVGASSWSMSSLSTSSDDALPNPMTASADKGFTHGTAKTKQNNGRPNHPEWHDNPPKLPRCFHHTNMCPSPLLTVAGHGQHLRGRQNRGIRWRRHNGPANRAPTTRWRVLSANEVKEGSLGWGLKAACPLQRAWERPNNPAAGCVQKKIDTVF